MINTKSIDTSKAFQTSVVLGVCGIGFFVWLLSSCEQDVETVAPTIPLAATSDTQSPQNSGPKAVVPEDPKKAAGKEPKIRPEMTDWMIYRAVKEKIYRDPQVSYNDVDASVSKGIVTIFGKSENLMTKERATRIAETVRGVTSVVNNVVVDPLKPAYDERISNEIAAAFAAGASPVTAEKTKITVKEGLVELEGKVKSGQQRRAAIERIKSVQGVKALKESLVVGDGKERPDAEINRDVQAALTWDALLDGRFINVKVKGKKVTVTGFVGSLAEKRRAVSDAYVPAISGVDAEELKMEVSARDSDNRDVYTHDFGRYEPEPHGRALDDRIVLRNITENLVWSPYVSDTDVHVSVSSGAAVLEGAVGT